MVHPASWLVWFAAALFAVVFGRLGVQNHRNFGTWSYDMGIYDQGFWLVSQGGDTFMTVRGLDFWGHHVNLIGYAFVPFYWLGAGPSFLLRRPGHRARARRRARVPDRPRPVPHPWMGLVFAVVYLMYAPLQWISWAMFHPEALVITPFLFAWWFATREHWGWCYGCLLHRAVHPRGHGAGRVHDGPRAVARDAAAAHGDDPPRPAARGRRRPVLRCRLVRRGDARS